MANNHDLIEQLAEQEHASWARWMAYLFSKCERGSSDDPDNPGGYIIPAGYVEALQRQIDTPYADLTEEEQQYDRDEVAHILPIIHRWHKRQMFS